jgi:amino acid adenylation domain-containing protein
MERANQKLMQANHHPQPPAAGHADAGAIRAFLIGKVAEILHVDADTLDSSVEIVSYGVDSIAMFEVVGELAQWLNSDVDATLLWEYPSIDAASAFLATQGEAEAFVPIEKVDQGQALPASFGQRQIWLAHQAAPDPATYNQPVAYRWHGFVDRDRVRSCLQILVERHAVFRTALVREDDKLMQKICAAGSMALPWVEADLQAVPVHARAAEMERRFVEEARRPFGLAESPLWRVLWLGFGEDEHVLVFTFHHSLLDEWSLRMFFKEWERLYAADAQPVEADLPVLPVSYADYAVWQSKRLSGTLLEQDRAYWSRQLGDIPPVLELPADKVPSLRNGRGDVHRFQLMSGVTGALRRLARQEGASVFTLMLSAFQAWLYRHTWQDDIIVGTPTADRARPEVQHLAGFFLNTLPIRTRLDGDLSFRKLLAQVRGTVREALEHGELPLEQIVEIAARGREGREAPLFRTMFALVEEGLPRWRLGEAEAQPLSIHSGTNKSDLVLNITAESEVWGFELEYATDLFTAEGVGRMAVHMEELLQSIVANPDEAIGNLDMLPDDERRQLLVDWNRTEREYPHGKCVHQLFEEQVARTPNASAVVFEDTELTYAELNKRANQLAHHLRSLGIGPGVHVGICMNRSIELIVALLAILKAGGIYVPLDPDFPAARLAFMLKDTAAPVVLAQESQRNLLRVIPGEVDLLLVDTDWPAVAGHSDANLDVSCSPEDAAYVIYTSGSTGQPKGVIIPHRAINSLVINTDYVQVGPGDVLGQAATCAFDAATFEIWSALLNGAQLVVIDKGTLLSAKELGGEIARRRISTLFLTTALFNYLAKENAAIFAGIKNLLFGGEACDPGSVRAVLKAGPPSRLMHVYGPTETTTFATFYCVTSVLEDATTVPIGRPIADTRVYVLDSYLNPVPIGVPGEIYIGGAGVGHGYLNSPDLTAEKFVAAPFEPGDRLYRTGDRARWRASGDLEFLGRLDFQAKIRGFRIEPGETEAALRLHPCVKEVVVTVREDARQEKCLVAYIAGEATEADLRHFLKSALPEYMRPSAYVMMDRLPLTVNGKIDRSALPAPAYGRKEAGEELVAPRDATEEAIAKVWRDVLAIERVGIKDNFFELGGHSMLAVQMLARLEAIAGRNIPLATLFAYPTIRELAKHISSGQRRKASLVIPIREGTGKPPFFLFYGDVIPGPDFCYALGQHLGDDQPLYVVSPPDLQNYPTQPSLEETARVLIESMRTFRPHGPYVLCGYCYGGLIAYEAARQLEVAGEQIENLILIDSFFPKGRFLQHARRFIEIAGARAGVDQGRQQRLFTIVSKQAIRSDFWLNLRGVEKLSFFQIKMREWLSNRSRRSPVASAATQDAAPPVETIEIPLLAETLLAFQWELAGFHVRPFPGRLVLFLSEESAARGNKVIDGWQKLVTSVDVHLIPGNHGGCVTSHRDVLLQKLATCLAQR